MCICNIADSFDHKHSHAYVRTHIDCQEVEISLDYIQFEIGSHSTDIAENCRFESALSGSLMKLTRTVTNQNGNKGQGE